MDAGARAFGSVVVSLAAHAAVLALDGIERVRSQHKHFGIFTCEQAAPHALLSGAPASLRIPHSRWNGVPAGQLAAKGYQVLMRTSDGGVDTAVDHRDQHSATLSHLPCGRNVERVEHP